MNAGKVYEPLRMCHTFPAGRNQEFVCKEQLYVSDTSTESSYRKSDEKNKGMKLPLKPQRSLSLKPIQEPNWLVRLSWI